MFSFACPVLFSDVLCDGSVGREGFLVGRVGGTGDFVEFGRLGSFFSRPLAFGFGGRVGREGL